MPRLISLLYQLLINASLPTYQLLRYIFRFSIDKSDERLILCFTNRFMVSVIPYENACITKHISSHYQVLRQIVLYKVCMLLFGCVSKYRLIRSYHSIIKQISEICCMGEKYH